MSENTKLGVWHEDLIWCPSQCYYYFMDPETGEYYCIYLRWRHSDPWTSELVPCDLVEDELQFNYDKPWEYIETRRDYSDSELKKLEKDVIRVVKERFRLI